MTGDEKFEVEGDIILTFSRSSNSLLSQAWCFKVVVWLLFLGLYVVFKSKGYLD